MDIVLTWLIFGAIVGLAAGILRPYTSVRSVGMSLLLGVTGAVVGGFLSEFVLGKEGESLHVSPIFYIAAASVAFAIIPQYLIGEER